MFINFWLIYKPEPFEYPVMKMELDVAVHEKVVPGWDPARMIRVESPEQMDLFNGLVVTEVPG